MRTMYVVIGMVAALSLTAMPTLTKSVFAPIDDNPNNDRGQCIKTANERGPYPTQEAHKEAIERCKDLFPKP